MGQKYPFGLVKRKVRIEMDLLTQCTGITQKTSERVFFIAQIVPFHDFDDFKVSYAGLQDGRSQKGR